MNEDQVLVQAVDIAVHLANIKELADKAGVEVFSMAVRVHLPSQKAAQDVLELVRQISDLDVVLANYYLDSDTYDFEYRP